MTTFLVSPSHCISATTASVPAGAASFRTHQEFVKRTASWSMSALVQAWNQLPNVSPVARFMTRASGRERIWQAIQALAPAEAKPLTKRAIVIGLLRDGATVPQLMAATGWRAHSVRGFLSVLKREGIHTISSGQKEERVYRLAPCEA